MRRAYAIALDAFWQFLADDGWAIASHIALSVLMAMFPFFIVLTSLAGFFGSGDVADQVANLLLATWPEEVAVPLTLEIHSVLTTYNASSAYVQLERWHGDECYDCGRDFFAGDGYYCESCEHDYCEDCARSCGCTCKVPRNAASHAREQRKRESGRRRRRE